MRENDIKQKLLEELVNENKSNVSTISKRLNIDTSLCYQYFEDMHNEDLISFINSSTKDGKDAIIEILGKGKLFFENGGYLKKDRVEKVNKNVHSLKTYIIILAAIMTIISVVLGIRSNFYMDEIKDLKLKNDTLQIENQRLKQNNKQKGQILIIETKEEPPSNIEDFNTFIYKFCSDTSFQKDRIKFPIEASFFIDFDQDPLDTTVLKNDWKHNYLIMKEEYVIQTYDNFESELRNTDERLISYEGVENGILVNYYFKKIDNLWYLIRFEDYSN